MSSDISELRRTPSFQSRKAPALDRKDKLDSMGEGRRGDGGRERKSNQKKKLISSTFQGKPGLCKILHSKSQSNNKNKNHA